MSSAVTDRRLGLVGSVAFKPPCDCATLTNITLYGEQSIDGLTTSVSRVLVKNQTDTTQNGIYDTSSAAWTRAIDSNGNFDFKNGTQVYVAGGSSQNGTAYQVVATNPITIGTSSIVFSVSVAVGNLAAQLASSSSVLGSALVYGVGRVVDSIAALRLLLKTGTARVFVTGYYAVGDGGGGHYYYDSTDTTTADNGGNTIVASDSGRWKLISTGALSVRQFGAKGDGTTNDTASITAAYAAAFATGYELLFPAGSNGTYAVTTVTFDQFSVRVRFQGNARLKGIASTSTAAVLELTGRQMVIYDMQVDGNFSANYTKGNIWWHSVSVGTPAQYNKIFGLINSNCVNGIVFGDVVGGTPVDAPQSENVVIGYTQRACQVPFTGNQPNGFITFHDSILDCNPNEWTTQPGYNAVTFQTAAMCFNNPSAGSNHVTFVGGEFLKTTSTLGYGFKGGNVTITSPNAMEIAGTQFLADGQVTITDSLNGSMTCGGVANSALPTIVIDPAGSALAEVYLRNYWMSRPATSSVNSTANFATALSGSPVMPLVLEDCHLIEYRWDATVPLCGAGVILKHFSPNNFITVNTQSPNSGPSAIAAASATIVWPGPKKYVVSNAGTCTLTLPLASSVPLDTELYCTTLTTNTVVSAASNVIPQGGTVAGTAMLAATAGKWLTFQPSSASSTNWRVMSSN